METRENHCSEYIGELTAELARMARDEDFEDLAFVLEMAALEAAGPFKFEAEAASQNGYNARRR